MSHTILIVDDSPTVRELITTILESHTYDTMSACNGCDGLEKMALNPPDLVGEIINTVWFNILLPRRGFRRIAPGFNRGIESTQISSSPVGAAARGSVAPPGLKSSFAQSPQVETWGYLPTSLRD